MDTYQFNEILPGFYSVEMGFVRSFMFVDSHEVLLVDLGIGGSDLKGQVIDFLETKSENISAGNVGAKEQKKFRVICTHGDRDHIGDAQEFDRLQIHPSEMNRFYNGSNDGVKVEPIWEGDSIVIGDYCLEVILIPGHTPGSIALLDRSKGFLIGGDSIQRGPIFMFGEGRNFQALIVSMEKLEKMMSLFKVVYACHHDLENPPTCITDVKEGAKIMLENPPQGQPQERFDNKVKLYDTGRISFFAL